MRKGKRTSCSPRDLIETEPEDEQEMQSSQLAGKLVRTLMMDDTTLQNIFTISVILLVLLNYINMGCAIDLTVVRSVIRRPIAPAIGFISQYLFMPVISYVAGYFLLGKENVSYWFGLFAFGCSPGGNASNMWTLVLGGNLDLSLTMTFLSTFSALFMVPAWLFTIGTKILGENSSFKVPYRNIVMMLLGMAFFLAVGLAFQRFLPRIAKICRRILVPISTAMIVFIVIFSTYVYWSVVKKLTLQMFIAAGLNVWSGFAVGFILSYMLNFSKADKFAIMIETGVQNTGISIMLIKLALKEPESDSAMLLPVAASLMTPIPLTILWVLRKFVGCDALQTEMDQDTKVNSSNSTSDSTTDISSRKIAGLGPGGGVGNGHIFGNGDTGFSIKNSYELP